jgi:hypothetical protein
LQKRMRLRRCSFERPTTNRCGFGLRTMRRKYFADLVAVQR